MWDENLLGAVCQQGSGQAFDARRLANHDIVQLALQLTDGVRAAVGQTLAHTAAGFWYEVPVINRGVEAQVCHAVAQETGIDPQSDTGPREISYRSHRRSTGAASLTTGARLS